MGFCEVCSLLLPGISGGKREPEGMEIFKASSVRQQGSDQILGAGKVVSVGGVRGNPGLK